MPASNLPDFRHTRSASLTKLSPTNSHYLQDPLSSMAAPQRFDGPRSPPNTAHVPCKFFRQGACQAGNSCPFSHDIGAATETICKYFAKGNCKFGPKCANIHVLPDGRRVNYGKNGVTIGVAPLGLGNRINPTTYLQSSNSALTNSFLHANATAQSTYPTNPSFPNAAAAPSASTADDRFHHSHPHQIGRQPSLDGGLPTIDTTYSSNPASVYGSPPGAGLLGPGLDEQHGRAGLGMSPVNVKVLSVLDAPLPASFDSNGISHAARYGPWPASVPSKFGIESPTPSLHNAKDERTSETLKLLHTSAFGSSERLSAVPVSNEMLMGSSPTAMGSHDEYYGKRAMHSSMRYSKPRLLSSSAPKVDRDWDTEFLFLEEDYVPGNLANEVLTPQEKARRGSMRLTENDGLSEIPTASNSASASVNATKFGSPVATSIGTSPSRWNPWFAQQQKQARGDDDAEPGNLSRSMKHAASAFGHVGSPLRNSSFAVGINGAGGSGELGGQNGDLASRSLSRSASIPTSESFSMLSQQLQRTRMSDEASLGVSSPRLHPNSTARNPSVSLSTTAAAGIIGRDRSDRGGERENKSLERHFSSGSIGSSSAAGRFPTPIDEEDPAFLFSMEEEDEASASHTTRIAKRRSGNSSLWSYDSIAAGKDMTKGQVNAHPASSLK